MQIDKMYSLSDISIVLNQVNCFRIDCIPSFCFIAKKCISLIIISKDRASLEIDQKVSFYNSVVHF